MPDIFLFKFDLCIDFFRISEIFCDHFFAFFTHGESGEGGYSEFQIAARKNHQKACHFQISVLLDDPILCNLLDAGVTHSCINRGSNIKSIKK